MNWANTGGLSLAGTILLIATGVVSDLSLSAQPVAAQSASPVASESSSCTITPRPVVDFFAVDEESSDALSSLLGTPVATPLPPTGGDPAEPEVVEAATETMEEVTACINATDLRRLASLLTDDQFRRAFGGIGEQMLTSLGTPTALPEGVHAPQISVEHVLVLPDGRVSAVTGADGEADLTIFKEVGGRYLIDASYQLATNGTPTP